MIRMLTRLWIVGSCLLAASLGGCTNVTQNSGTCVPGTSVACACQNGQQGAQTCTSAGTYAACVCTAPASDAGMPDQMTAVDTHPPADLFATIDAPSALPDASAPDLLPMVGSDTGRDSVAGETQILECPAVRACMVQIGTKATYEWIMTSAPNETCDDGLRLAQELGCTAPAAAVLSVVPSSITIPGWVVDQSISKTSGMVAATATTAQGTTDLIGSAAANFFAAPYSPVAFAWQNYINASLVSPQNSTSGSTLKLYILQMPSADQACGLYTSLLSASLYHLTWADPTSPTVGTKSRITDSGTDWWINFCKGNYYVEVRLMPSYAADFTPSDPGQKKAAMDFAVAVAANITPVTYKNSLTFGTGLGSTGSDLIGEGSTFSIATMGSTGQLYFKLESADDMAGRTVRISINGGAYSQKDYANPQTSGHTLLSSFRITDVGTFTVDGSLVGPGTGTLTEVAQASITVTP